MKRNLLFLLVLGLGAFQVGCSKGNDEIAAIKERQDSQEKRIEALEKAKLGRPMMPPEQEEAYNISIGSSQILGKKDAKINLVVFSDYQCPFCAKADPILKEAIKDPELKDHINLVFKQFPLSFHQNAKSAAKAALAAGEQGKFWEMSDKLFANQSSLSQENYKKWAKEIGLNVAKWESDLKNNDGKYEDIIKKETEQGINEAKVRGTPSIYVNGWELKERSVAGIKQIIKEKKLM